MLNLLITYYLFQAKYKVVAHQQLPERKIYRFHVPVLSSARLNAVWCIKKSLGFSYSFLQDYAIKGSIYSKSFHWRIFFLITKALLY